MEMALVPLLKLLLSGGVGFSIGMMVAPRIKKEVEKAFGPAEITTECDQHRLSGENSRQT